MKIGIPVVCQNDHANVWVLEIVGLETPSRGVLHPACECSKWRFGEGYRASGRPPYVLGAKQ